MKFSVKRAARFGAILGIALTAIAGQVRADVMGEPGSRKRLGNAGEWKDTKLGVVLKEKIYTIETGGGLYRTDMSTGKWVQIGKVSFPNAKFLMAAGSNLYVAGADGTVYTVNPNSGAKKRLGSAGIWKNVNYGVGLNGALYSVTSKGGFYRTNLATGKWQQIGGLDYKDTALLLNHEKAPYSPANLFSIEKGGSLYKINPANGSWLLIGKENAWAGTKLGTIMEVTDTLYAVNAKGELVSTMLSGQDAAPYKMGKADYKKTKFLFAGNGTLVALDSDGSLYSVTMAPMAG